MFEKILMGNCRIFQDGEILFIEFCRYRINHDIKLNVDYIRVML